jgi:diguanylate cyclase (GGDEF)-like protein
LLWFELFAMVVGAAQFAVGAEHLDRPALAGVALGLLGVVAVVAHVAPALRSRIWLRCAIETAALLIYSTMFAAASGGVRSPILALHLLPLTAAALALGRWAFALTGACLVGAGLLLGWITPGIDISSSPFVVLLIGDLAPAIVTTAAIAALMDQMQVAEQHIRDLSSTDPLTGLYNLRTFEELLADEHRRAELAGRPYSVVIVDVDNVGQINETLGHDAGTQLIVTVSAAIARSIRTTDLAARLGGDEFVILLFDTDATLAATVGQRIRNNVYAGTISVANRLIRANVCLGAATFPNDHLSPRELMIMADQRMQQERKLRKEVAV